MASTITALDTPTDVSLGTTTLQVTLPANATRWSVSCGSDVLWYPTGTDGGAVNSSAETLPLSSGAVVELNCPGASPPARNLGGHVVYLSVASGSATATVTARAGR